MIHGVQENRQTNQMEIRDQRTAGWQQQRNNATTHSNAERKTKQRRTQLTQNATQHRRTLDAERNAGQPLCNVGSVTELLKLGVQANQVTAKGRETPQRATRAPAASADIHRRVKQK